MARCVFDECWVGRCKADGEGDPPLCGSHRGRKCWCGAQAVKNCSVASSFVCGMPTCADHECQAVAYGLTGSHGAKHSKKGHAQWLEWKASRERKEGEPPNDGE